MLIKSPFLFRFSCITGWFLKVFKYHLFVQITFFLLIKFISNHLSLFWFEIKFIYEKFVMYAIKWYLNNYQPLPSYGIVFRAARASSLFSLLLRTSWLFTSTFSLNLITKAWVKSVLSLNWLKVIDYDFEHYVTN